MRRALAPFNREGARRIPHLLDVFEKGDNVKRGRGDDDI